MPVINAHQKPHGYYDPSITSCSTWSVKSGRTQAQEGVNVSLHLSCPNQGMTLKNYVLQNSDSVKIIALRFLAKDYNKFTSFLMLWVLVHF